MEISGVIVVLQNKNSSIIMFNRFDALPVGAHSWVLRFNFLKMCNIHLIIVVFPVPGPPVITLTPYLTAFSIALTWFSCIFKPLSSSNGDKDQLPSVGAGNILGDIIAFNKLPISYLTYIYRQDHHSMIVENAHRINNGEMPIIRNSDSDFLYSNIEGQEKIAQVVVDMVSRRIPSYMKATMTTSASKVVFSEYVKYPFPPLKFKSNKRWIVFAGSPLASASLFDALPVGAHSWVLRFIYESFATFHSSFVPSKKRCKWG